MNIYQKQKDSARLAEELEAFMANKQITVLPMGFTHYQDGILPQAKVKDLPKKEKLNSGNHRAATEHDRMLQMEQKQQLREQLQEQKRIEVRNRAKKQVELLNEFYSKSKFGDAIALCKQLDLNTGLLRRYQRAEVVMSHDKVQRLELALRNFQYGLAAQATISSGQHASNRYLKKLAIAAGQTQYVAFCAKEMKETDHKITPAGRSYCIDCQRKRWAAQRVVERKVLLNKKLALEALERGENRFIGECKKHGQTLYSVNSKSVYRCLACRHTAEISKRKENHSKYYDTERTTELREFCGARRGIYAALAEFMGVSKQHITRIKYGYVEVTDDVWQKFQEFKPQAEEYSTPHGTVSGYTHHKCRCDACKKAISAYHAARYKPKNPKPAAVPDQGLKHGVYLTYSNKKCRCMDCRKAWMEYKADNKARKMALGRAA